MAVCTCGCGREWGGYEEDLEPTCSECKQQHIRTRCGGSCRRTMCVTNPHVRFYCPRCGQVTCGLKRQGKWIVLPHYKTTSYSDKGGRVETRPCTGGDVDYSKDRAP